VPHQTRVPLLGAGAGRKSHSAQCQGLASEFSIPTNMVLKTVQQTCEASSPPIAYETCGRRQTYRSRSRGCAVAVSDAIAKAYKSNHFSYRAYSRFHKSGWTRRESIEAQLTRNLSSRYYFCSLRDLARDDNHSNSQNCYHGIIKILVVLSSLIYGVLCPLARAPSWIIAKNVGGIPSLRKDD
jgi:hypothetical protein